MLGARALATFVVGLSPRMLLSPSLANAHQLRPSLACNVMKPGNRQQASLSSFPWFLSFCRKPRPRLPSDGSRAVVGEGLSLFLDARYISRANGSVQPARRPRLAWCCSAAPTHVGRRSDERLDRAVVASCLVQLLAASITGASMRSWRRRLAILAISTRAVALS